MIHKSKLKKTKMRKISGKNRDQLSSIYSEIKTKGKQCSRSEKYTDKVVQFQGEFLWESV